MQAFVVRLLFALVINISSSLSAGNSYQSLGWVAASANISVVGKPNPARLQVNPGLYLEFSGSRVDLSYGSLYSGLDIVSGAIGLISAYKDLPVIGQFAYIGDDFYQESKISIAYPIKIDSVLILGGSFQLLNLAFGDEYRAAGLSFSPSLYFKFNSRLRFGSSLWNMIQLSRDLKLPQRFQFGVSYHTQLADVLLGFDKESALPLELGFAIEAELMNIISITVGYRDQSQVISTGWGLEHGAISIYFSFIYHPLLPNSHGLSLAWTFL
jgi:hypothetical protein